MTTAKNILIITERSGQRFGWERYTLDIVKALEKKGHKIMVISAKISIDTYTTLDRKDTINPPLVYNSGNIIEYRCLPPALSFKKTYLFSSFYKAKALSFMKDQNFRPDLVHCCVEPYSRIAQLLAHDLDIPYYITAHGSYAVRPFSSALFGLLQKGAYKNAKAVICVSHYTRDRILSYVSLKNLFVINNGVDLKDTFNNVVSGDSSAATRSHLLLSVGGLKERKGYIYIIKALAEIIKKIDDLKYVIVGNQSDKRYFHELQVAIARAGLHDRVQFRDKVPDSELISLYEEAKVFILTPVSTEYSFEGFGLVYLEANAHGTPAIGSYGNGGEDAVVDGKTGFMTTPRDPKDIARKVIDLMTMPNDRYAQFSKNARQWASGRSWDLIINKYIELYENIDTIR